MDTTNINVHVDSLLKQESESLFSDLGLNMTAKTALDEYEEMKNNPDKYKRYKSFDDILDEVFVDA